MDFDHRGAPTFGVSRKREREKLNFNSFFSFIFYVHKRIFNKVLFSRKKYRDFDFRFSFFVCLFSSKVEEEREERRSLTSFPFLLLYRLVVHLFVFGFRFGDRREKKN